MSAARRPSPRAPRAGPADGQGRPLGPRSAPPERYGSLPVLHLQPAQHGAAGAAAGGLQHAVRRQRLRRRHVRGRVAAGQNQSARVGRDGNAALRFLPFAVSSAVSEGGERPRLLAGPSPASR